MRIRRACGNNKRAVIGEIVRKADGGILLEKVVIYTVK